MDKLLFEFVGKRSFRIQIRRHYDESLLSCFRFPRKEEKKWEAMIDFSFDSSLCHLFLKAERGASKFTHMLPQVPNPLPPPNQEAASILVLDPLAPDQLGSLYGLVYLRAMQKSFKSPSNQHTSKERNLHKISKRAITRTALPQKPTSSGCDQSENSWHSALSFLKSIKNHRF